MSRCVSENSLQKAAVLHPLIIRNEEMGVAAEILSKLDNRGILIISVFSLIVIWVLTIGREWCKRELSFLESAVLMPGPRALPIIGNVLVFACSYDDILDRIVKLSKPYINPFRFWMGTKLLICLTKPRDIEVVLNTSMATHKPYEYRFLASYLGPGIVTNSGSLHRSHRKLIVPMVNGNALNGYLECFDKQSRRCAERLESRVDTGEFDIIHYMDDCTLDIILETVMGAPGTAQEGGHKGIIDCCARAISAAHERTMKGWLHSDWIYSRTKAGQQFVNDMDALREFTGTFIKEKKKEYNAAESEAAFYDRPLTAALDRLIGFNSKNKIMDDEELRDELANIWMPAQDPTALTSSFLFLMLGIHPEIQDKVRAEVREVVGDGDITLEQISKLRYLEMVFKETVRLFPVGPIILREPQEDLVFESCTAPKGCTIALLVYMTHRDPEYWTEPEKFMPERFTPENSAGRHPFAFVPFSHGIRGCIGRQYATMMMKVLVARVIQKYRIHSNRSMESLRLKAGVSVRSIDGYHVSISKI